MGEKEVGTGIIVLDMADIYKQRTTTKPFMIQAGSIAFDCDMYFPRGDYTVIGTIIKDDSIKYEDQKVIATLIKGNVIIHEFESGLTVKTFMNGVRFAMAMETKKAEDELQAFKGAEPPGGGQYA